jgi:hypothetical protein
MKKRKKMDDIGAALLTKSRKEPAAIRLQELGLQVTSAMNLVGQDSASSHFGT